MADKNVEVEKDIKSFEDKGKEIVSGFRAKIAPLNKEISEFGKKAKSFISSNAYIVIGAMGTGVEAINDGAKKASAKIKGAVPVIKNKIALTAEQAKDVAGKIKDNSVAVLNNAEAGVVNSSFNGYNKLISASANINADFEIAKCYASNALISLNNAYEKANAKYAQSKETVKATIKKAFYKITEGTKLAIKETLVKTDLNIRNVVQKGMVAFGAHFGVKIETTKDFSANGKDRLEAENKLAIEREAYNAKRMGVVRELSEANAEIENILEIKTKDKITKEQMQARANETYKNVMDKYAVKEDRFKEKLPYKSIFAEKEVELGREVRGSNPA